MFRSARIGLARRTEVRRQLQRKRRRQQALPLAAPPLQPQNKKRRRRRDSNNYSRRATQGTRSSGGRTQLNGVGSGGGLPGRRFESSAGVECACALANGASCALSPSCAENTRPLANYARRDSEEHNSSFAAALSVDVPRACNQSCQSMAVAAASRLQEAGSLKSATSRTEQRRALGTAPPPPPPQRTQIRPPVCRPKLGAARQASAPD